MSDSKKTGNKAIQVRMEQELLDRLDAHRKRQQLPEGVDYSRATAVRSLFLRALEQEEQEALRRIFDVPTDKAKV